MTDYASIGVIAFAVALFSIVLFLAKIYKRCPSNKVLVVFGRIAGEKTVQCYHGGGTFVWPLIQDSAYLDLTPRTIHIPLKGALSQQNIRINVPSTFTVAIGTTLEVMNNAAVRVLTLKNNEIESMATEIILGQLRLTVASLRIEEINQDRERFLESIKNNIEPELHKIGLTLINVNITDITDESDYIESIGKKAIARAVNQAKIDVAEQYKQGEIGKAAADKERFVEVASLNAQATEGENLAKAKVALVNSLLAEKEAEALKMSEIAKQKAQIEIQQARSLAETKRLEAEEVVPKEIAKRKMEIDAAANAQREVLQSRGEAEALINMKKAEAQGIAEVLAAKSKGYELLVAACEGQVDHASTMLLIEKLENLVHLQAEAIKNLKIDKITVWDSGREDANGKTTTSNFISGMVKSLPALHDVAAMAGLDLPNYLGQVKKDNLSEKIQSHQ
jgi:flotillin